MINFVNFVLFHIQEGAEFSRSSEEIIIEANQLVENGAREITLLVKMLMLIILKIKNFQI